MLRCLRWMLQDTERNGEVNGERSAKDHSCYDRICSLAYLGIYGALPFVFYSRFCEVTTALACLVLRACGSEHNFSLRKVILSRLRLLCASCGQPVQVTVYLPIILPLSACLCLGLLIAGGYLSVAT